MIRVWVAGILLGITLVLGTLAIAQNPDGSVTVTPSVLYEMIQQTRSQTAHITGELRERIQRVGDRLTALENTSPINPAETIRIQELERKVAGMQKQITILHAKKADK